MYPSLRAKLVGRTTPIYSHHPTTGTCMTPFALTRCWFRGLRSRSPSPCLGSSRGIIGSLPDDSDIGRARKAKLPPLSSEPPLERLPARSPHSSVVWRQSRHTRKRLRHHLRTPLLQVLNHLLLGALCVQFSKKAPPFPLRVLLFETAQSLLCHGAETPDCFRDVAHRLPG